MIFPFSSLQGSQEKVGPLLLPVGHEFSERAGRDPSTGVPLLFFLDPSVAIEGFPTQLGHQVFFPWVISNILSLFSLKRLSFWA